ncbi:hypothetical protein [Saccharopolyspora gregorii]|uniref:hypothetical protein n=1 Tax=Saccharopolyspora gregorii TaxID=33914 RepID=UPI0021ABD57F|nr:hypothetical protein [Saccharopolyspora gregorii]
MLRKSFRTALVVLLAGALLVVLAVVLIGPSSISLQEEVLHEERSQDSGMTYVYGGEHYSSDLRLLRVVRPTGVAHELRLGPHVTDYYYPVLLELGAGREPRVRDVGWLPDRVVVRFESGESLEVPADNFRSVR